MGGRSSKPEKIGHLTDADLVFVNNAFLSITGNKTVMRPENLFDAWSHQVDPDFVRFAVDACFRKSEETPIKVKPFAKFFYIATKAHINEKADYITKRMFNVRSGSILGVYTAHLITFIRATIRSYFSILGQLNTREYQSWLGCGVRINQMDATRCTQYMTHKISLTMSLSMNQIEQWLYLHPLFCRLFQEVVIYLFSNMNSATPPKLTGNKPLPLCSMPQKMTTVPSILSIGMIMFINECLPAHYRLMWMPLYNSKLHGESFSQLISRITHQGPTVLVIKDDSNYIFGAIASTTWRVGPQFTGDLSTSLFTLEPNMNCYISSGHNSNFQYLNFNQKTMPNGLGIGGQLNYWGLWLDQKYGVGKTSVSCSTFVDYKQLSPKGEFHVDHLEVWCVDVSRKSLTLDLRETHGPSVLSRGLDRYMTEMSGHEFSSLEQEKRTRKK